MLVAVAGHEGKIVLFGIVPEPPWLKKKIEKESVRNSEVRFESRAMLLIRTGAKLFAGGCYNCGSVGHTAYNMVVDNVAGFEI